jgi:hypothetical protein
MTWLGFNNINRMYRKIYKKWPDLTINRMHGKTYKTSPGFSNQQNL